MLKILKIKVELDIRADASDEEDVRYRVYDALYELMECEELEFEVEEEDEETESED